MRMGKPRRRAARADGSRPLAVRAAQAAQREARRAALLAEAVSLRAEAAWLDGEAERHEAKTRELLDRLREHEGGDYAPLQPPGGSIASDLRAWTSRSQQLRIRANAARKKATRLELQAQRLNRSQTQPEKAAAAA
jgi:hypothetical protein